MRLRRGLEGLKEWARGKVARQKLQHSIRRRLLLVWLRVVQRGRRNMRVVEAACKARQLVLVQHCWSCWSMGVGRGVRDRLDGLSMQLQVSGFSAEMS